MNTNTETLSEPTAADLAACEADLAEMTEVDWEALLEPVIVVTAVEDFWHEDDNVHDDRYDGSGVPAWSAWA